MGKRADTPIPEVETSFLSVTLMVDHIGRRVYIFHRHRQREEPPIERTETFAIDDFPVAIEHARHILAMFEVETHYQLSFPW